MQSNLVSPPVLAHHTYESPAWRRWLAAMGLAALCGPVFAQPTVVGPGQTRLLAADTTFDAIAGRLHMDGGILVIRDNNGNALNISATDAILGRGWVSHPYAQQAGTVFNFYGTTQVTGAPALAFPADGMYFGANQNQSRGLKVLNHGTFEQTGTGQIRLFGPTMFVNGPSANYFVDNDQGMLTTFNGAGFFNDPGATIAKRSGTGTSVFDIPIAQSGARVELRSGSLSLNAGGWHDFANFYADPLSSGHGGKLQFGSTHNFSGYTVTETGAFLLKEGAEIRLINTPPVSPIGEWEQRANFEVRGTVQIDGSTLRNSGHLFTMDNGAVTGSNKPLEGGTFINTVTGTFSGNIKSSPDPFFESIKVVNQGQFIIEASHRVLVSDFTNQDGVLTVNGELSNSGGRLELLGGVLQGSGIINSDVFVGGGPGTAVFKPGNSPGTMTIDGNFSLLPGGVLDLEIQSIGGGIQRDTLAVSGSIFLDGLVNFLVGNGVTAADVAGLDFFDCDGRACDIQYGSNFRSTGAQLAPVPEPSIWAMWLAGIAVLSGLARRRVMNRCSPAFSQPSIT